jgi:hypothetical protein
MSTGIAWRIEHARSPHSMSRRKDS